MALLAVFVLVVRSSPAPLLRLAVLTRRPVVAGNLVMLVASGLLLSIFFLNSQYLQQVLRLSALDTGLIFLPVALVIGLGTPPGSAGHRAVRRTPRRGGRVRAGCGRLAAAGPAAGRRQRRGSPPAIAGLAVPIGERAWA